MRYIKKTFSPFCLDNIYQDSLNQIEKINWENLNKTCKKNLVTHLASEQYQLCAYTEIALQKFGYHIEHIKPKSVYPEETFNYDNLVLSCFSSENLKKGEFLACFGGQYKKDEYDENKFISPLNKACEHYFSYIANGRVEPHPNLSPKDKEKVLYTCDILNLNAPYLIERRKKLITATTKIIDELLEYKEALIHFADMDLSIKTNPNTMNEEINPFYSARLQQFGALGRKIKKKNNL